MFYKKIILVLLASVTYFSAYMGSNYAYASPVDTYEFHDEVTKIRFQALVKELRCPKCQNQNLADSNSPISKDLRRELYDLLQAGKADIFRGDTHLIYRVVADFL